MDELYIADGYTAHKSIEASAGFYPALEIAYRPALAKARIEYRLKSNSGDAAVLESHENDLILKYVVSINGHQPDKHRIGKMKPVVRTILIGLVLGYEPEDEAQDAKNSRSV